MNEMHIVSCIVPAVVD